MIRFHRVKLIGITSMLLAGIAIAQTPIDTTRMYHIDEVVVTGSNSATGRNLLPYMVSNVGNAQIEATGKSQLMSAISGRVPSLFVSERNNTNL